MSESRSPANQCWTAALCISFSESRPDSRGRQPELSGCFELSSRDKHFRRLAIKDSGNDLVHHVLIPCSVSDSPELAIARQLPPPGFIGKEPLAFFRTLLWIVPEHGVSSLVIKG